MTKVCHVTSVHKSNDTRVFYKECSSLAKAGYDTYLVARGDSREENGVHVIGVGQPSGGRISRMTGFAKLVYKKAVEIDADIYHLHDPELLPFGIKLKRKGKKVIFDSHEDTLHQMEDKEWIPKALRHIVATAYTHYAVKAFRKMDALVSVTPSIVEELKSINDLAYQITNYPIVGSKIDSGNTDKSGDFCLCFTGGIDDTWSHTTILSALSHIQGVRYVLCGPTDKDYLEKLSQLDGWKRADYRGVTSHEEAVNVQLASNVGMALLQPSGNTNGKTGTLGNTKFFEYMMSGLPLICTDFVLWKAIIDKYNCGICVDPDKVGDIEAAIQYLVDNPEEAWQMGLNGRRAVEQEFNWAPQEKVLLEMYTLLTPD